MTSKILVPAKKVMELHHSDLDLTFPTRCSRCNAVPAGQFETHELVYEAGLNRFRQFNKKFRTVVKFRLRLPVCENCYTANFVDNPDSCEHDTNDFGRIARLRSAGILTASLLAGAAFILLMKFFPLPAQIPWLQYLWMILIAAAMLLFGLTYGWMEIKNKEIRGRLKEQNYDFSLRRAYAYARMQVEDPEPDEAALIIALQNDDWAKECATHYAWKIEAENQDDLEAK